MKKELGKGGDGITYLVKRKYNEATIKLGKR